MELKIISFNIRCCDDENGNSIAERAPRLNEVISHYDADLIGFQEYTPQWEKPVMEYFGKDFEIFNKYRAESQKESAPILWRKDKFECLKKGYFWLSDTLEVESRGYDGVYNCFRICEYAVLREKQSNKTFTFMNTHFGFGDNGQSKSVNLIYEYSKKISSYPTFIVGDFNMTPDDVAYSAMCEKFTDVNAVTANDLRTTYHGYNPEGIKRTEHIDFCFTDGNIKPVSQKIIDDTVDGMFPSDHYGIYVKIELQ